MLLMVMNIPFMKAIYIITIFLQVIVKNLVIVVLLMLQLTLKNGKNLEKELVV